MSLELESYEFNTLGLLDDLAAKKLVGPQAHSVASYLLRAGAFIAGGFARQTLHHLGASNVDGKLVLRPSVYSDIEEDRISALNLTEDQFRQERGYALWKIGNYLGQDEITPERAGPWKGHKNDIDIFFPSEQLRDAIIANPPWYANHATESIGKNAINIYCDNKTYIQAITRFVAPLEETLDRFDIVNGAVALTKDRVYIPKTWYELERLRTLKVNHWRHDQTPRRINMWMRKHGLTTFHADDLDFFNDKIEELFNRLAEGEKIMVEGSEKVLYDLGMFLNNLKDPFYATHMNGYMLTLFASLAPFYDNYNWAMNELKRRGLPLDIQ